MKKVFQPLQQVPVSSSFFNALEYLILSKVGELSGYMVECLTRERGVAGLRFTGVTAL